MLSKITKLLIITLFINMANFSVKAEQKKSAYNYEFKSIDGKTLNLGEFKNKVIVVINVASRCGFTKQYKDMQKIWEDYKDKGVVILGVPSNDFNQELESNDEIKKFCETNFGITFPMTEKVSVKGPNAHPFYLWAEKTYGKDTVPKWNFHKIIIGKKGQVESAFTSFTKPTSEKFIKSLNKNLSM